MTFPLGKYLIRGAFSIVITLFMVLPPLGVLASQNAILDNIILTNTRDDLIVYFDVKNAFTPEIEKAVHNGIPASFSFVAAIYRARPVWFDKKISSLEITNTLKYNSLKQEFTVYRPWRKESPIVVTSFDEAKALMVEIDNLLVTPLSTLTRGERYQIRIKAELSRVTLPLYLHYVLFFVSMWDFETDWHTMEFIY
ncbi:hypothetical protein HRM2_11180 [Desulforapulum autotrophicum HRM2]|uniref:DUF4390 domain-containing protein n=1 Tax=Desulforapulum autotrophicum (strain ATCC 43914 / DSM 3382 / VKM B-1955 / HRM2) TaxID=177437 RepID=C0QLE4_DESAH|nr:DUF4390 domain-containing protein [Desulforapulum autotrophicum]ACN14230.1 hypothetical protein HRM2_11180 [Desulforapulum autotrophicum HRM2]